MRNVNQQGFTLISAIFLLVVLAVIGGFMVSIGGSQRATSSAALQGARAFQAARSGMEWAIFRVVNDSDCSNVNTNTFTLADAGLNGFTIRFACQRSIHSEAGVNNVNIFTLTATATNSTFGSADYVRRVLTATVSPP